MYIHSIKLRNYKSIGEEDKEIILEPRITAIVGKNESGKSNVLEGISRVSFLGNMKTAFTNDNINRNNGTDGTIEYTIILKPNPRKQNYSYIFNDTQIIINKDTYSATGGMLEYYKSNILGHVNEFLETLGKNPFQFQFRDQAYTNYTDYVNALQQENSLNIKKINDVFVFIEANLEKMKPKEIPDIFTNVKLKWDLLSSMFPKILYRNSDKVLKTYYKLEEVQKELQNPVAFPNSLLSDFVKLIDVPINDFMNAAQAGMSGQKTTIRKKINNQVDIIINNGFKNFYTTEPINLNVDFDSNMVSFSVYSDKGEALLLSERSNGLRWYLNTYIDAQAHGISQSNAIYLFDEPGISLHINAQKEVLTLFEHLANRGNQVVYTTHSPYMLHTEGDGIHRIRAVDKDSQGYTHIYKTAYDRRLSPQNQEDTLSPIIGSIGMSLYDTFGPAKDKINIVTEGVSDYIYLKTMAKILNIDDRRMNIIPSFGVDNCLNICNILHGWDCPFVAVFDFDKKGVESGGEKMQNNLLYEYGKQYIYLKDIQGKSVDSKEYDKDPYRIEDLIGIEILEDFIKKNNLPQDAAIKHKTLLSKLFCNALEDGSYCVDGECQSRFSKLFERMLS